MFCCGLPQSIWNRAKSISGLQLAYYWALWRSTQAYAPRQPLLAAETHAGTIRTCTGTLAGRIILNEMHRVVTLSRKRHQTNFGFGGLTAAMPPLERDLDGCQPSDILGHIFCGFIFYFFCLMVFNHRKGYGFGLAFAHGLCMLTPSDSF
jgi:hypothetical protein